MCSKCSHAHVRAQLRRLLVGLLLLIFFSLMATDILTGCTGKWEDAARPFEPTDENVEALNPPELEGFTPDQIESLYHNEDSYPVSERPPVRF